MFRYGVLADWVYSPVNITDETLDCLSIGEHVYKLVLWFILTSVILLPATCPFSLDPEYSPLPFEESADEDGLAEGEESQEGFGKVLFGPHTGSLHNAYTTPL